MAATLLESLRNYLAAQGIVRAPRVSGSAPPLWLDPKMGVPYPGQTEGLDPVEVGPTAVLAAYQVGGVPPKPFEGFIRTDGVDFWIRTNGTGAGPLALSIEAQIRQAINDKRNWVADGLLINQSYLFRDLQRVGSDQSGYTYSCGYLVDTFQY